MLVAIQSKGITRERVVKITYKNVARGFNSKLRLLELGLNNELSTGRRNNN